MVRSQAAGHDNVRNGLLKKGVAMGLFLAKKSIDKNNRTEAQDLLSTWDHEIRRKFTPPSSHS